MSANAMARLAYPGGRLRPRRRMAPAASAAQAKAADAAARRLRASQ